MATTITDTITLTTDADLLAKLQRKSAEYEKRSAFTPPEINPLEYFKMELMRTLLTEGKLVREEQERKFHQHFGVRGASAAFNTAVSVIATYNAGETLGLVGGTGLT